MPGSRIALVLFVIKEIRLKEKPDAKKNPYLHSLNAPLIFSG
jgi:hypothetical protein